MSLNKSEASYQIYSIGSYNLLNVNSALKIQLKLDVGYYDVFSVI